MDYIPIFETLTFVSGSNQECSSVSIIDDSTVEDIEEFSIILISSTPEVNTTTPSEAIVLILDDDGEN